MTPRHRHRHRRPLLLLLLILLLSSSAALSACLPSQSAALLRFKHALRSASTLSSWIPATDCCSSWSGVTCSAAGLVTALDLSGRSLSGKLHPSLFNLTALVSLNLADNLFDLAPFPHGFHLLHHLAHLNLSNTGFTGQIPAAIASLTSLVTLDLSTLDIDSTLQLHDPDLSTLLRRLGGLRHLYLDGVNISGGNAWCTALSESVHKIKELSLVGCSLSGPIDTLTQLQSLSLLRLDENPLNCAVPDFIDGFTSLSELGLSSCGLEGRLPETVFKLGNLTVLDVSHNPGLTGFLPELPSSSALESLVLSNTNLSGTLPESIGGLKSLTRLQLAHCRFYGQIPSTIGNLTQLVHLDMSFNNLSGEIPSVLKWGRIVDVDLSNNVLAGSVPVSLGDQRLRRLAKLDLRNNLLSGPVPASLLSLPSLQVLQLSQNQLSGELREFPNASTVLSTVDLSYNKLRGQIPSSVFNLLGLKILSLSSNNFSGAIELSLFGRLRNLSSLDLSNNWLSVLLQDGSDNKSSLSFPAMGTLGLAGCNLTEIPVLLKHQTMMSSLDLSNNRINGVIPNWIWEIGNSTLTYMNLSCNQFTDVERPLPEFSVGTINTISLDLHSNKLHGPIPLPPTYTIVLDYSDNNFGSVIPPNISFYLVYTIFFSMSNNSLTGAIPPTICNASYLEVLDLSDNKLSGSIPPCLIQNISDLHVLNLRGNQLHGTIPNVSQGCALQTLNLNGNWLTGRLPMGLGYCRMLEVLDLGSNALVDSFPYWLGTLPQLQVLVLRANRLYGTVSPDATNNYTFPMLQIFDLSSNRFHGSLPSEYFPNLKSMMVPAASCRPALGISYLKYTHPSFYQDAVTITYKGQLMTFVKILTVLTYIDFSDNGFDGSIPVAVGGLTALYMLNMSQNSLTGSIPASLGQLRQLEALDLSSNQLSGKIPPELANLTFLAFLNLSDNELIGRIPVGTQLSTFGDAFGGNEGLCGVPLPVQCSSAAAPLEMWIGVEGREPSWNLILGGAGFGTGLAVVFWGLRVCKEGRRALDDRVDRMMWAGISPVVRLCGGYGLGVKVGMVRGMEGDEEEEGVGGRRYCVFCTKVEVHEGREVVIHDAECECLLGRESQRDSFFF